MESYYHFNENSMKLVTHIQKENTFKMFYFHFSFLHFLNNKQQWYWSLPPFTPALYMQLCIYAYVWKLMYIYKMIGHQKGGNLLPWQNNITRWIQALTHCVELIKTYSLGDYYCIGIMTRSATACMLGCFSCVRLYVTLGL